MSENARRAGMDHEHYRWSPIVSRPRIVWPRNAAVAVAVMVDLEYFEPAPPLGSVQAADMLGGLGPRPYPQIPRLSHREYGHRVGIFRILDALEARGIPPTIAIDAMTAEEYPFLVEYCLGRGADLVAHGIAVTRIISSAMDEPTERAYIEESLERLRRATGVESLGWYGPEGSESTRTPRLLAAAGVRFVCDWVNDEQPYAMTVPEGRLTALPVALDLDDGYALGKRGVSLETYGLMLRRSLEQLVVDGAVTGRVLLLNLHPWIIGQPFRIGALETFLDQVAATPGVWTAKASEIVASYEELAAR